jgi:putative transposase
MSAHVFHEIYLHLNWHTQSDLPLLRDDIERAVHSFIRDRCRASKGVRFEGVGGTPTHVHLVVQLEPFVCPSTLVGDLKGASAREINKRLRRQALRWQRGFGVVSFAKRHLGGVLDYVARQKELHAARTLKDALESHSSPQPSVA